MALNGLSSNGFSATLSYDKINSLRNSLLNSNSVFSSNFSSALSKYWYSIIDIEYLLNIQIMYWDLGRVEVYNNGPSKICGKKPLKNFKWFGLIDRPYHLNFLKAIFHKFLNTLTHFILLNISFKFAVSPSG